MSESVSVFNYLKMACQSVEEFDLKISASFVALPLLLLYLLHNTWTKLLTAKVFGGVARTPHASLSTRMTGVRMPIWAALIEFSKLYIYIYIHILSNVCLHSIVDWFLAKKLSRCHCNTHLIRLLLPAFIAGSLFPCSGCCCC